MSDKNQISSPHAMYGNVSTYHDSPATEGQGGLLDSMFPSPQAYIKNDVDSVIEFLDVRRQRINYNAEAMKELYLRRQSMMAKPNIEDSVALPILNGGAFLPFTGLGFGRSDLDAFQYHLSQGLGMDILHHADALNEPKRPVSMKVAGHYQASAALSHNMQTSMTEIMDRSLPCGEVARCHDKRAFIPAHATPQSSNLDYGHAPEIGLSSARSCLPGQTISPASLTYISDNRDGHVRSSVSTPPRNRIGGPTVLSFISGGIKHYRCECGYESVRKGDVHHHIESLQHSERKYGCSCGKKFTRYDSLKRHGKRCRNRGQMGLSA
ncbi:hypothetical protein M378DRAFT_381521 [Amanita muscaria Koide BX008]|uniref:C2H2-type domain-containing protein n=1 Tax=Amanita muscaria (strain Koide BX008) TaxID=946122 RepID=A0A0C2WMU3_AMAMK|nr:hypothetical protein M378DRAFT_381521 [Amanita muscaria Koide BX008]